MKTTDKSMQVQAARLSEGMSLIFDQDSPSSSSSRSSSRSSGRSRSTSRDHRSSRSVRRSHRRRSCSRSSSRSSTSGTQSRSRSHPRCHRQSSRHQCRRHCHSPPRRYRARSRSYSPSPDRPRHRRSHGSSAYRRYRSRSPSSERYHRRRSPSRSRSPNHRRHRGFVGRYRNRLSDSPRRSPRSYRSRSRTPEQSSVRLSQDEKKELLKIAAENAEKIVGSDRLVLPENVKNTLQSEEEADSSPDCSSPIHDKWVRQDPEPQQSPSQVRDTASEDGDLSPKTSPMRKPIMFSINNTVAKPTHGKPPGMAEVKVTPRVDIVGSKKPYGQWVPVKTKVPLSSKH